MTSSNADHGSKRLKFDEAAQVVQFRSDQQVAASGTRDAKGKGKGSWNNPSSNPTSNRVTKQKGWWSKRAGRKQQKRRAQGAKQGQGS